MCMLSWASPTWTLTTMTLKIFLARRTSGEILSTDARTSSSRRWKFSASRPSSCTSTPYLSQKRLILTLWDKIIVDDCENIKSVTRRSLVHHVSSFWHTFSRTFQVWSQNRSILYETYESSCPNTRTTITIWRWLVYPCCIGLELRFVYCDVINKSFNILTLW